jgi:hypothetical protein
MPFAKRLLDPRIMTETYSDEPTTAASYKERPPSRSYSDSSKVAEMVTEKSPEIYRVRNLNQRIPATDAADSRTSWDFSLPPMRPDSNAIAMYDNGYTLQHGHWVYEILESGGMFT